MGRTTNEIKRKIEKKEQSLNRPLTKEEKRKITTSVTRKVRREYAIRAMFLSIGVLFGAGGHAMLTSGENTGIECPIDNVDKGNGGQTFIDTIKVTTTPTPMQQKNEKVNYELKIQQIIDQYNEMYNEDLTIDDISYMKSKPQFLGIDSEGTYIQDYKEKTEVQEYVTKGISDIYIMINKEDNSIISSIGKINSKIENIDTKVVKDSRGKEYFESNQKIDVTKNKEDKEIDVVYEAIKNQYEKELEEER